MTILVYNQKINKMIVIIKKTVFIATIVIKNKTVYIVIKSHSNQKKSTIAVVVSNIDYKLIVVLRKIYFTKIKFKLTKMK